MVLLLLADDKALFADSKENHQKPLDLASECSKEKRLDLNIDKSLVMI